jgi:hypothetical protein
MTVVTCEAAAGGSGALKRLGGNPVVTEFASGAAIEVATGAGCRALVTGPMTVDVT